MKIVYIPAKREKKTKEVEITKVHVIMIAFALIGLGFTWDIVAELLLFCVPKTACGLGIAL